MASYKFYNPILGLNLPPFGSSVLPVPLDQTNQPTTSLESSKSINHGAFSPNPSSTPYNSGNLSLYNPFSDYLGLAQMVERRHMADNFEKLVTETCIVPGADIYNEVNRLFFQEEQNSNTSPALTQTSSQSPTSRPQTSSRRERTFSWTSGSDSGHSSDSSHSPIPAAECKSQTKASLNPSTSHYQYSQSVMVSSSGSSVGGQASGSGTSASGHQSRSSNLLLKPVVTSQHLQLNLAKHVAMNQSSSSNSGSMGLGSGSVSSVSRLPPSVQLARKLTAKSMCVFCKNNGEMESVFSSHVLKNEEGAIVCPILRAYTCPICGVSGDKAHTIKYCPQGNNESTIKALKQTRNSTASRRGPNSSTSGLTNPHLQPHGLPSMSMSMTHSSSYSPSASMSSTVSSMSSGGHQHHHQHHLGGGSLNHHHQHHQAQHHLSSAGAFHSQLGSANHQVAAAAALLNVAHLYGHGAGNNATGVHNKF